MFTVPRIRREVGARYRLEASKCRDCGYISYPPRKVCPKCKSDNMEKVILPDEGEIYSYTVVRVPAQGFSEFAPFPVALVKLTNGVKILLQVVDSNIEDIAIGKKVKLVFRRLFVEGEAGPIIYGPKCKII